MVLGSAPTNGSLSGQLILASCQASLRLDFFVELEPNVIGLIYSSKLPSNFRTNDALRRGKKVRVVVLKVDRTEKRMELEWVPD